jgi:hypothetical protein
MTSGAVPARVARVAALAVALALTLVALAVSGWNVRTRASYSFGDSQGERGRLAV